MSLVPLEVRGYRFDWSRVYTVGVLNVTPDSFSDGGLYVEPDSALARACTMLAHGADILDIGGESTRPGAQPVSAAVEIERTVPLIRRLRAEGVTAPISIDTTKAEVAGAAISAGADIVNDVSGGLFDPDIVNVTARAQAVYICGHVRGTTIAAVHASESEPPTVEEVGFELAERVARLPMSVRQRTIVDPCLGFGKRLAQNVELVRWCGQMSRSVRCPIMIGPSRKRFVRTLASGENGAGRPDRERVDLASVGVCLAAVQRGAHFLRIHNIEMLYPVLMSYEAIMGRSD